MVNNIQELKTILQGCIGSVYQKALEHTGEPAAAKELTRLIIDMLKRSYEAGIPIDQDVIDRLTADCIRESDYYDSSRSAMAAALSEASDGKAAAPAAPQDSAYDGFFFDNEAEAGKKQPNKGIEALVVSFMSLILAALAFCLVIMLISRHLLPGWDAPFVQNFILWFNTNLFPLF